MDNIILIGGARGGTGPNLNSRADGQRAMESLDLMRMIPQNSRIDVVVDERLYDSITEEYLLGMFEPALQKLGAERFRTYFRFRNTKGDNMYLKPRVLPIKKVVDDYARDEEARENRHRKPWLNHL